MAVATSIFGFWFFFASIINAVKFFSWYKKPRAKAVCKGQTDKEETPRGKRFTYSLTLEDDPEIEEYSYTEKVDKNHGPSLFAKDKVNVLVNKSEKTAISEKDFAAIKKNMYMYPLLWLLSVGLTCLLIYITSLF